MLPELHPESHGKVNHAHKVTLEGGAGRQYSEQVSVLVKRGTQLVTWVTRSKCPSLVHSGVHSAPQGCRP